MSGLARQRELSLVVIMLVLGGFVYSQSPQFLSAANLSQVTIVAAIIAIAATGQALVVLTRNVDLSVDAMIGLVAFSVADLLRTHTLSWPLALAYGVGLGLLLGIVNGAIVSLFRVPAIVATLGTMSVYRGLTFLFAGGRQVSLSDLPPEYIGMARTSVLGVPLYVMIALVVVGIASLVLQQARFGRQVYAVGSNPEAAAILGIRSRLVGFIVFALCGMLAGLAGVLWGARFGTINATAANGVVLQVVAAVVVGGVNIFGGSGTVYGAALGALFLGLIANALTLLHLSQFWLQAIYGAVILAAVAADAVIVRRLQRVAAGTPRVSRNLLGWRAWMRWEVLLAVTLVVLVWLGTRLSAVFLSPSNFSNLTVAQMEIAIIAVPMTLIIIVGEIDLSVESMVGLSSAVLGFLWAAGLPLWVGIPLVLIMGALGGLINGILVMRAGLPSLVVTLGTLALFRGLASVVLGPRAISNFPAEFSAFGFGNVPGTPIPWPLVAFALLTASVGVVLHGTWLGRQIFAVGKNQGAARYSGVPVVRLKTVLFIFSGVVSAIAGVILTSRLSSARSDAGAGMTLAVVTAVLLGGVNIFGGSGTILGVVLAIFTLAVLQNALRLADVSTELQSIAIGVLLIVSVVVPNLARRLAQLLQSARAEKHPTRGAPERVPPYTPA